MSFCCGWARSNARAPLIAKAEILPSEVFALSVALQGRELELCHTPDIIAHRRNRKFDRYVRP
jgi:hypothetical protein